MTIKEVLSSVKLKKRFCKDYNIPISVYENPYFYDRICTLNRDFDSIIKFSRYCNMLEQFANEQEYFEAYNESKETLIQLISNNGSYQNFLCENFVIDPICQSKNLYSESNDGKKFVSIDMKQANYSSLNYYDSKIFGDAASWEEFVINNTGNKYIANSKYIRQVVLGACNPKRQISYEKYLTDKLARHLISAIEGLEIFSESNDEIIIRIDGSPITATKIMNTVNDCPGKIGELFKVECFVLHKIAGTGGWMKAYTYPSKNHVEFKCLSSDIYHQVVKHYYNMQINEDDLVFEHEGKLVKYLRGIENPWK